MATPESGSFIKENKLLAAIVVSLLTALLLGFWFDKAEQDKEPKATVVRNGAYEFHLGNSLFVVPRNYVQSFGLKSTDGLLYSFTLHAKLPEFSGYTHSDAEVFKNPWIKGRIEITVHADSRTRIQSERYWYDMAYVSLAKRLKFELMRGDSLAPKKHEIQEVDVYGVHHTFIFIVGDGVVLKDLRCDGLCRITIVYKDYTNIYAVFDERYKDEWVGISDEIIGLLSSFEK